MAANSAADAVDVARLRAEPRRVLANRVGDEARREVAVVVLDHSGISVAEVRATTVRSERTGSQSPLQSRGEPLCLKRSSERLPRS